MKSDRILEFDIGPDIEYTTMLCNPCIILQYHSRQIWCDAIKKIGNQIAMIIAAFTVLSGHSKMFSWCFKSP